MPKPEISIVYIADGFEEDCEMLLQRYLISNKHNYQAFCNIWKEMKFAYIFHGRTSTAELGEFSEEVLHVAKKIMVKKINNIEESIGAMFILYGLVHLQPFKRFGHIRLVPEDVSAIKRIESFAREHKRYDVLYILGSLLIEGPLHYHLTEKEYGLERSIRKYFEEQVSIQKLSLMKGVLYQNMEILDVLQAETNISQKYKNAKSVLQGKHQPQHDLNYANEHLAGELMSSLKHLVRCGTAVEKTSYGQQIADNSIESRQAVAQEIKQRAMRNLVAPMRHLLSVQTKDRQEPPKELTKREVVKDTDGKRDSRKVLEISSKGRRKRRKKIPLSPKEDNGNIGYILSDDGGVGTLEAVNLDSLTQNGRTIERVPAIIEFVDEIEEPVRPSVITDIGLGESFTTAEHGLATNKHSDGATNEEIILENLKAKEDIKIRHVPWYKKSTLNKFGMLPIANVTNHHPKRKSGSQVKNRSGDGE